MNHEERQKRIAEAAYYRSLRRGLGGDDHQLDDWLEAEREVAAMAAEPEQPEEQATPPQPDQTSGVGIPAPLAKEDQIRAAEVKQSARDLANGSEAQNKLPQDSKPAAKKTRKRRDGRSTAELRRSV